MNVLLRLMTKKDPIPSLSSSCSSAVVLAVGDKTGFVQSSPAAIARGMIVHVSSHVLFPLNEPVTETDLNDYYYIQYLRVDVESPSFRNVTPHLSHTYFAFFFV